MADDIKESNLLQLNVLAEQALFALESFRGVSIDIEIAIHAAILAIQLERDNAISAVKNAALPTKDQDRGYAIP